MYVCNCNGVTKREVDEAIDAGAQRPEDVLGHHGCEAACGRCLPEIAECIGRVSDRVSDKGAVKGSLVAAE